MGEVGERRGSRVRAYMHDAGVTRVRQQVSDAWCSGTTDKQISECVSPNPACVFRLCCFRFCGKHVYSLSSTDRHTHRQTVPS